MADRVLALVGPGKGPRLRARKGSKLRVSGLLQAEYIIIQINENDDLAFIGNGDHPIPDEMEEIRVEYKGANRNLRCFLLSDKWHG